MRMGRLQHSFSLLGALLVLALVPSISYPARGEISPQCQNLDYESARDVFTCTGTMRHRGGSLLLDQMDSEPCAASTLMFLKGLGANGRDPEQARPSCATLAEVSEMMTGDRPYWASCTNYPGRNTPEHMQACVSEFAKRYYGEGRYEQRVSTCQGFIQTYERGLQMAINEPRQRLPESYSRPDCAQVNQIIAGTSDAEMQWPQCANYDSNEPREHLLACMTSEDKAYAELSDCNSVRAAYEERLRATHGGLPEGYSILPCSDARVVLEIAEEERQAQQERLVARREERERQLQEARQREQQKIEEARAEIRARQRQRNLAQLQATCDAGPNRFPDHEYGEALTATAAGCGKGVSPKAQIFLAGLAEGLVRECGLPEDVDARMRLANFVNKALPIAMGGSQYGNPDLGKAIRNQSESQQLYVLGTMTFQNLESCNADLARELANGMATYLERSASVSSWVDGCEVRYAATYSRDQCECMAESIRAIKPGIHTSPFSRDDIPALVNAQPSAGLQMAATCGVGDY